MELLAANMGIVIRPSFKGLRHEREETFRAVLSSNFERFDLVSRELFDIQADLLART